MTDLNKPSHTFADQNITSATATLPGSHSREDILYIDAASPHTHPDSLFAIASIFGMTPAPVTKCRVLSLAAFDGSNLIAIAASLPSCQFVGLSNTKTEFDEANKKISALQLKNIEIRQMDIMDIQPDIGEFDYILAQGIYSWVDAEKRKRILQLCRSLLNANGVAYVNYNAYPGWRMHQSLRDMLLYHVRDEIDNKDIIQHSREFTDILALTAPQMDHLYGLLMQSQQEMIKSWSDDFLFHDTLGPINQPFYFHEFMADAAREKLQFLSDAQFHTSVPVKFPEKAINLINTIGSDRIVKEQYMDFFRNRMFKQTLLCHDEVKLMPKLYYNAFRDLHYIAAILPESSIPDIQSNNPKSFKTIDNISVTSTDPMMKALLFYLSTQYPVPKGFSDIAQNIKKILGKDFKFIAKDGKLSSFDDELLKILMHGYSIAVLKVFSHPINVTGNISQKPEISPLARYEAEHGLLVTNQFHEVVRIDTFTHHVLPNLTGQNTVDDIIEKLIALVDAGKITFRKDKDKDNVTDKDQIRNYLRLRVESIIKDLSRRALLIS